jgi:hypothetical protein
MVGTFKESLALQFEAAFCTISACIKAAPAAAWNAPVGNLAFCQVAFHVLFFADLYLGTDEESLRGQQFHLDNQASFRDYEELEDRPQQLLYERPFIEAYLGHCRKKAAQTIAAETAGTLSGPSGFKRRSFSRAEHHLNNLRHLQHHAAQLSLRLRIDFGIEIPWFGSGWRDA